MLLESWRRGWRCEVLRRVQAARARRGVPRCERVAESVRVRQDVAARLSVSAARRVLDELARRDYERRTDALLRDVLRDETPNDREPLGDLILRLRARDGRREALRGRRVLR